MDGITDEEEEQSKYNGRASHTHTHTHRCTETATDGNNENKENKVNVCVYIYANWVTTDEPVSDKAMMPTRTHTETRDGNSVGSIQVFHGAEAAS